MDKLHFASVGMDKPYKRGEPSTNRCEMELVLSTHKNHEVSSETLSFGFPFPLDLKGNQREQHHFGGVVYFKPMLSHFLVPLAYLLQNVPRSRLYQVAAVWPLKSMSEQYLTGQIPATPCVSSSQSAMAYLEPHSEGLVAVCEKTPPKKTS